KPRSAGESDAAKRERGNDISSSGLKGTEDQKRLTVHYTGSQHHQENVFIAGSRPQYLEDLHTEAQEGLKILQQEGKTLSANGQVRLESEVTAETDDATVTSPVPTMPLLTHQGSTFKPVNPVKRLDKSRRRNRRTTIMGIPNQVQKELGMYGEVSDSQPGVIIIPTVDGGTSAAKSEGARVHLSELENEHLNQHGYESNRCSNSSMRPKSLAVPGMTTAAPFFSSTMFMMSISPQATYLSTIIPNAILPASIEVIEIDRTSSRTRGNSIKNGSSAISKSPSISRRSGGDDRQVSHSCDNSVQMPSSVSGSNWSETQSSKTIPSNSSPASSKGSSRMSTFSTCKNKGGNSFGVQETGSVTAEEDAKNKQNFSRSLSVMKTRQPPAPPQRTNSLHINKIKNKSRVLMETQDLNIVLSAETGATAKKHLAKDEVGFVPGGNASMSNSAGIRRQDLFSSPTERACVKIKEPEKMSPEEVKFERTISPSSGYSSQSGTPTLSPKGIPPTSPDKQRKPIKPERSTSRASSSAASPFSSLTSLSSSTTETVHSDVSKPIMLHKRLLASTEQPVEKQQTDINGDTPIVDSEKSTGTDSRSGVIASVDGSNNDSDTVSRLSPPPTPPAADHLTPPSSVSAPPEELEVQEENHNTESCWPPPPPPPPPPLEGDSVSYLTDEETSLKLLSNKEHPSTVPASIPGNVFLRPDILKTEDEPSLGPISNGQIAFVVPAAPPLPAANTSQGANFRKQPNGTNRDARSKELLSRHKGAPIPKEDANIPLVTPSLLQMVRLRSVTPANENCSVVGTQNVPQKPIRKSLSLKSSPQMTKTPMMMMTSPSVRLQEAIRIKTAAMCSRDELPSRLGVRSSAYSCLNEKTPGRFDMHKCPASTASFIFAKSAKKVVIETVAASSPEAQTGHKQGLEVEPTHMAERSMSSSLANGEVKYEKVPPPVAQKPAHGGVGASLHPPACVEQLACTGEVNEAAEVQHTGEITPETTSKSCG
uniref:NHS like 3 n=1 Tax=Cynoglossus semilaevis TaxID=244447 RepID=A0A3P8VLB1_CYNSE